MQFRAMIDAMSYPDLLELQKAVEDEIRARIRAKRQAKEASLATARQPAPEKVIDLAQERDQWLARRSRTV